MKFRVVQTCKADGCDRPLLLPASRSGGYCCECRDDLRTDVSHLSVVPKQRPRRRSRAVPKSSRPPVRRETSSPSSGDHFDRGDLVEFLWRSGVKVEREWG